MRERQVLVVDDEPGIRRVVARLLSRQGWHVSEASDGEEAAALLLAGEFDLIITDLGMPRGSGQDLFAHVTGQKPDLAGRFIFMSGDTVDAEPAGFLAATGSPTLQKPFELGQLVRAVAAVLSAGARS